MAIDDRELFESYICKPHYMGSECAFTNMFLWRRYFHTYWTVDHNFLLIKVMKNGKEFFLQPFGGDDADLPLVLRELKEYNGGKGFEFHGIYENSLARLKPFAPNADYVEDRDNWDYVYLQKDLANLSGRKYHGQKNHYNVFKKDYPDYVFEPITPNIYAECLIFGEEWCRKKMTDDESLRYEMNAIREAFVNFTRLDLRGGAIRVNGKIKAFGFGKKINDEVAVLHVEKADADIRGLYTAINKECAEYIWQDVTYLNREEDMGLEGLRRAKESYHPVLMVKKYNLFIE